MWFSIEYIRKNRATSVGSIAAILIVLVGGILNYFTYSAGADGEFPLSLVFLFACYYSPLILFNKFASWQIVEFGFVVNRAVWFSVAALMIIGAWLFFAFPERRLSDQWSASLLTAFARVGEELLFRGFIYLALLKAFQNRSKPYMWAVFGSSLAFALVHTQCLLPGAHISMSTVFLIGLAMAYLRYITGSLLPAVTIHCYLNSDLLGVVFGWAIYCAITMLPSLLRSLGRKCRGVA